MIALDTKSVMGGGGRRRTGSILAGICLLAFLASGNTLQAATPITGVSCGGGFFVKIRSHEVFWIDVEERKRTSVYRGGLPMFAMAQCGKGVLTVFDATETETPQYDIYHSSDCRNIGVAEGNSALIHSSSVPVVGIRPGEAGVSFRFADGSVVESDVCRLPER